ncbi:MAG: peptidylprolyl isomerase [Candidatus Sericytochromatia bacterium]|nr:peptidylprolyl isomerase [Candidatus Sericytochromatia bacterium]
MKRAIIETEKGTIELELFAADAPNTVANFEQLAKTGVYNGTTFHRVIPNFMIQGGDPLSKELPKGHPQVGTGGPGYKIKCETAGNPHKHLKGTLSMAHAGRDTGGSQFFITHTETPWLDGMHTVFGRVTAGQDVVDAIEAGDAMLAVLVEEVASTVS